MPLSDAVSFPLGLNAAIFAGAMVVVWIGGTRLTHHLDAIAVRTGMDHAFVGMLLLGGITSLPELANVITASSAGDPGLAINNLLGSAAINVLLLAVADAFIGRSAVTSIVAQPSTMMMATLCMLVLIAIAAAITVGDVRVGGLGVGAVLICALSVASFWIASGHDERSPWTLEEDGDGEATGRDDDGGHPHATLAALWLRTAFYGALIFAAGYALSQTGDAIAEQTGIGSALVGFALIGVATSAPELSTVVAALRLERPEMAFGQVLGTNFVNLSMILVADLVFRGEPVLNTLGKFEIVSSLLGAALIGVLLVGLLEHRDRTVLKMGYDSAAVILLFGFGLAFLATV